MMARKSKIDEDCEQLSVVADQWNLKLKPTNLGNYIKSKTALVECLKFGI